MSDIERFLKRIEDEMNVNPNKIWEQLLEGDLLICIHANNRYIIEVKRYNKVDNRIEINFLYSLKSGIFRIFKKENNWESPDRIDSYPTKKELKMLRSNVDYLTYINNK